jgi:hypothetical protein
LKIKQTPPIIGGLWPDGVAAHPQGDDLPSVLVGSSDGKFHDRADNVKKKYY